MKPKLFIVCLFMLVFAVNVFAQNGGKAEPNRIKFAKGKSSAVVSDRIKGDEQAEYVFSAKEGQLITLKIASVPKGKIASFKVLNATEEAKFYTKYEENYDYAFPAPTTGDYLIWVTIQPEAKVKTVKFNLTLSVTKDSK